MQWWWSQTFRSAVLLLLLLLFWTTVHDNDRRWGVAQAQQVTVLTAQEFKEMIDQGHFTAILDVRTATEFVQEGHIANATLVPSLVSFGTVDDVASPTDLTGCEQCDLAVYCRSGSRATTAITLLIAAGFVGRLYNGLGINQWMEAGYPLVMDDISTPAPCVTTPTVSEQCRVDYINRTTATAAIMGSSAAPISTMPIMMMTTTTTNTAPPSPAPVAATMMAPPVVSMPTSSSTSTSAPVTAAPVGTMPTTTNTTTTTVLNNGSSSSGSSSGSDTVREVQRLGVVLFTVVTVVTAFLLWDV